MDEKMCAYIFGKRKWYNLWHSVGIIKKLFIGSGVDVFLPACIKLHCGVLIDGGNTLCEISHIKRSWQAACLACTAGDPCLFQFMYVGCKCSEHLIMSFVKCNYAHFR